MDGLASLLASKKLARLQATDTKVHADLEALLKMHVYARSIFALNGNVFCMARKQLEKALCAVSRRSFPARLSRFAGEEHIIPMRDGEQLYVRVCPLSEPNAAALRKLMPWFNAKTLGVCRSFGSGDRLGIATPAHVQAIRGTGVAPILAQQSIREMERTGRSPQQVMATAMWGAFEEGWHDGFGSDADHLKLPEHVDRCAAAGFTMYTIDPGDHVDNEAQTASAASLARKFEALPWADLQTTPDQCKAAYAGKTFALPGNVSIAFDDVTLLRAAAKYGRAITHTAMMYRHLKKTLRTKPFELEMSVDETLTPTTPAEHYFIAAELKRLGVKWVSLAPRFIGDFEKGIDYKGSLAEFERAFVEHMAIARHLGPYKISLHSGSDKFSVYPIAARCAGELLHVKTAGTSYLEALRAIAKADPPLFRDILAFAFERYDTDRATYHVSATTTEVKRPEQLKDEELPGVLDTNPGRQLLHVTYGSVLTAVTADGKPRFKDRLLTALKTHEDVHYDTVSQYIRRHVAPLAK
jgi:tagaturonate epimerase